MHEGLPESAGALARALRSRELSAREAALACPASRSARVRSAHS